MRVLYASSSEKMIANLEHYPPLIAVSDGRPGNARQAEALTAALSPGRWQALHLAPRAPWRWASPRYLPGCARAFGTEFASLLRQPPRWAIGCGRQAALATRLLRAAGSQVVQILDPRLPYRHWDWLVVPEHDGVSGPNVIPVCGSLNPVDDAWLAAARGEFSELTALPAPYLTLLVGGDSRHGRLPASVASTLRNLPHVWHQETGGSVLATTSRRTPPALAVELARAMQGIPGQCWTGPQDGANPYPGFLAFAAQIVCTADSVNLISEACATRVPVCVLGAEAATGGPGRFVRGLLDNGRVQSTLFAPPATITPLRETARIAGILGARLGQGKVKIQTGEKRRVEK